DQLMAAASIPATRLLEVRGRYDRMRVEAVAGQYLDVLGESDPTAWSTERALLVARLKTASYTVQRPLQFGVALASDRMPGVDEAFSRYGAAVGEAFQLRDDLLGVYGDPAVTGKPASDDLRTGKPTTLRMLADRLASPAQRAELTYTPDRDADLGRIAQVITDTGAPAHLESMIQERVADAVAALTDAPILPDARETLIELAVRATHRPA
ncbi:MAG: polyprenyl synthetase family protein, partial [Actinoplanes sp.]